MVTIFQGLKNLIHFTYYQVIYSGPGITDKEVLLLSPSLQSSKESKNDKSKYFTLSFDASDIFPSWFYKPFLVRKVSFNL